MSWKCSVEEEQRDERWGGRGGIPRTLMRIILSEVFFFLPNGHVCYMLDLNKQQRMLGNICLLPVTNAHKVITSCQI